MTVESPHIAPDPLLERIQMFLEGSIVPSPHSIDLSHSAASDFLYRQARPKPHVAELYHENSKLSPHSTLQIPFDTSMLKQVRRWFFETAYSVDEETLVADGLGLRVPYDQLPGWLQGPLHLFSKPGSLADLLYAIDLLVLHDGMLFRIVPESDYLWVEHEVKNAATLLPGLFWRSPPVSIEECSTMLIVVACPWRYMILYGPRGYRHTLLDIGRLLGYLQYQCEFYGHPVTVHQDFLDTKADEFVQADGVERSVYALLAFSPIDADK